MKKSRFTDEQIMFALRQAESGTKVPEICRRTHGAWTGTLPKPAHCRSRDCAGKGALMPRLERHSAETAIA